MNCQIIPPLHGDAAPYCEAAGGGSLVKEDATKAVPMHFEDALQGADWERLIEASPAHALFFLGAKAKADGGEPINVRDWHVATPFLPTKGVVHLMQGGNATPDLLEKASDPVASNQTVKVEVRGRELDRSTIELDLATVLQTHLDGGEKTEDVLEIRTYRLVRVGDAAAPRSDHSGVSSRADIGRYVVASIDGEKADLSTVAPY
ncbi:MAG: hypothetical protein LKM32_00110 [Chiayiivirga sp.]|uniref:hypothetical protein n=1 Tax=Chiayiivirga sp. TaxID=2041042 RepID=UPI0025B80971|nr:hypothetical protein [Chiayiivirga sp.]MCI1711355.1 hypothetical protein [Chiayiivirga sp.]MCI1727840.1 hypothetical protein [Chiayiivirga sp.]